MDIHWFIRRRVKQCLSPEKDCGNDSDKLTPIISLKCGDVLAQQADKIKPVYDNYGLGCISSSRSSEWKLSVSNRIDYQLTEMNLSISMSVSNPRLSAAGRHLQMHPEICAVPGRTDRVDDMGCWAAIGLEPVLNEREYMDYFVAGPASHGFRTLEQVSILIDDSAKVQSTPVCPNPMLLIMDLFVLSSTSAFNARLAYVLLMHLHEFSTLYSSAHHPVSIVSHHLGVVQNAKEILQRSLHVLESIYKRHAGKVHICSLKDLVIQAVALRGYGDLHTTEISPSSTEGHFDDASQPSRWLSPLG